MDLLFFGDIANFEVGCNLHCFQYGKIAVQIVVLQNVAALFAVRTAEYGRAVHVRCAADAADAVLTIIMNVFFNKLYNFLSVYFF